MGTDLKHLRLQTKKILPLLHKEYPEAEIALRFSNPLELLIATILSAQCTDERVNKVTPILFSRYKKALDDGVLSKQGQEHHCLLQRNCGGAQREPA